MLENPCNAFFSEASPTICKLWICPGLGSQAGACSFGCGAFSVLTPGLSSPSPPFASPSSAAFCLWRATFRGACRLCYLSCTIKHPELEERTLRATSQSIGSQILIVIRIFLGKVGKNVPAKVCLSWLLGTMCALGALQVTLIPTKVWGPS